MAKAAPPLPVSLRAQAWIAFVGARRRAPLAPTAVAHRLARVGAPSWPVLFDLEARFSLEGDVVHGRFLWIGAKHRGFGRTRTIEGRPYVLAGGFDPILWYVGETGHVVEVDDLGERFFESDSVAHRIEQLALEEAAAYRQLSGRRGGELAETLDLLPIPEASDSKNAYWRGSDSEAQDGLLVLERFTPRAYGAREREWTTWLLAPKQSALDDALKRIP
jgi:hypothetical protein